MQSNWKGNFSQDIVNEIFVWLPVKSLLRLKCVCKCCGFEGSGRMTLWNPSMREFRPLPVPAITSHYLFTIHTFGFGFDPLTGNYKVIWIRFLMDSRTENPLPYFLVAVYTLGSDTWRYLDPLIIHTACDLRNSLSATCINGVYYWLASYDNGKHSILSFDMSHEVFRDIAGPDHPDGTWGSLTLCNDSVALFLCQYGVFYQSIIVLCMMKEEGCWDELVAIEPSVEVSRPLGFWINEEVLLESRASELFMYMRDTCEIRSLGIFGNRKAVFSYKESLLSVKGQNKNPKECNFSNTLGDYLTFTVPAAGDKGLVDKTEELGKLVECFFLEQDFYYRQARFHDEYENVVGLPDDDLAKGWPMIIDDPERLETFFSLDESQRSLYVAKLVRGG